MAGRTNHAGGCCYRTNRVVGSRAAGIAVAGEAESITRYVRCPDYTSIVSSHSAMRAMTVGTIALVAMVIGICSIRDNVAGSTSAMTGQTACAWDIEPTAIGRVSIRKRTERGIVYLGQISRKCRRICGAQRVCDAACTVADSAGGNSRSDKNAAMKP